MKVYHFLGKQNTTRIRIDLMDHRDNMCGTLETGKMRIGLVNTSGQKSVELWNTKGDDWTNEDKRSIGDGRQFRVSAVTAGR